MAHEQVLNDFDHFRNNVGESEGQVYDLALDLLADSVLEKGDRLSEASRQACSSSISRSDDMLLSAQTSKRFGKNSTKDRDVREPRLVLRWEGYLQKRSDWLKHWETYFFVLSGSTLNCYLSEEDAIQRPESSKIKDGAFSFAPKVNAKKVHDVPPTSNEYPHRFIVETQSGKMLHLCASSEEIKQTWMHMVNDGIIMEHTTQKTMVSAGLLDFYCGYLFFYKSFSEMKENDFRKHSTTSCTIGPSLPMPGASVVPPISLIFSKFFTFLRSDVCLRSNYLPMVPFSGTFKGHYGILDFFNKMTTAVKFVALNVQGISMDGKLAVVSGIETMEVRETQRRFTQQWVHKLHFRSDGRICRLEIYGDAVAASVVFKPPEFSTKLILPHLSENIRESVVQESQVNLRVFSVEGMRIFNAQSAFRIRCSLDGVQPSEQALSQEIRSIDGTTLEFNEDLQLTIDALSRDDNTTLKVELFDVIEGVTAAQTLVNLAYFINRTEAIAPQTYVLSNALHGFLGKVTLQVEVVALSHSSRRSSLSSLRSSRQSNCPTIVSSVLAFPKRENELDRVSSNALGMQRCIVADSCFYISEKYEVIRVVGKGAYGIVVAASDSVNGGTYAIKKIPQFMRHPKLAALTLREIKLMKLLGDHPTIMKIHALHQPPSFEEFDDLYIIQPLMETDLCRVLYSKENLTDDHIQYFVYQLVCGVNYLHSANVLHRDLKPSNILVNSDCSISICDFGMARHAEEDIEHGLSEYVVTRWYRAPELLLANVYEKSIDIWAIGCIFAELLGRKVLFPGRSYVDQLKVIMEIVGTPDTFAFCDNPKARRFAGRQFLAQGKRFPKVEWKVIFPNANPDALDLLECFLKFNPMERITAKEALEHPYFALWRDEKLEIERDAIDEKTNVDYRKISNLDLKKMLYKEVCLWNGIG